MPPGLEDTWPCYRLVNDKLATWTEVTTAMSILDVIKLTDAADAIFDALAAPRRVDDED